jgi:hypothetical protein
MKEATFFAIPHRKLKFKIIPEATDSFINNQNLIS